MKDKEGNVLTGEGQMLETWRQFFEKLTDVTVEECVCAISGEKRRQ